LFTLIDHQKIIAYTPPIIIANLHHILSRLISRNKATQALYKLKTLVKILPVDEKVIELAHIQILKISKIQYRIRQQN